eukprot:jgi/Botrbrau1/23522/Bobra.106_1s0069.1
MQVGMRAAWSYHWLFQVCSTLFVVFLLIGRKAWVFLTQKPLCSGEVWETMAHFARVSCGIPAI